MQRTGSPGRRRRPVNVALAAALLTVGATSAWPGSASAAPTGSTYVAMGDSYSSGEGLGSYLPGTDTSSDSCHRSTTSYPEQLATSAKVTASFAFVACSGAVTADLFATNHTDASEPAQDLALGTATKLVSVTIGGNDLGFSSIAEACLDFAPGVGGFEGPGLGEPGTWGCAAKLQATTEAYLADLAGTATGTSPDGTPIHSISAVLADIHARAPHAHIYLAGYPFLFGKPAAGYTSDIFDSSSGRVCTAPGDGLTFDFGDAQWARGIQSQLTAIDRSAVSALAATGAAVTYVDPTTSFAGHSLCGPQPSWINGIQVATDGASGVTIAGSFHPDQDGHTLGYAVAYRHAGF